MNFSLAAPELVETRQLENLAKNFARSHLFSTAMRLFVGPNNGLPDKGHKVENSTLHLFRVSLPGRAETFERRGAYETKLGGSLVYKFC